MLLAPAVLIAIDAGDLDGGQALAVAGLGAVDWLKEQVFFFTVATAPYLRASRVMKCMSDSLADGHGINDPAMDGGFLGVVA